MAAMVIGEDGGSGDSGDGGGSGVGGKVRLRPSAVAIRNEIGGVGESTVTAAAVMVPMQAA